MLVVGLIAIALGGLIYIASRADSLLMFRWLETIGGDQIVDVIRQHVGPAIGSLPEWIRLSLPTGLWTIAGILLLRSIWGGAWSRGAQVWCCGFFLSAIGGELAQWWGMLPGTFDPLDLTVIVVSGLFACSLPTSIRMENA